MKRIIIYLIFLIVIVFVQSCIQSCSEKNRRHVIDKKELVEVLNIITQSLRANPNQFQLNVNASVIGMQGVGGSGGPGIVGIAGGSGGTNIGVQANASSGDVDIKITKAIEANITVEMSKVLTLLDDLKNEVSKDKPSKSVFQELIAKLNKSIIPDVVAKIIVELAKKVISF